MSSQESSQRYPILAIPTAIFDCASQMIVREWGNDSTITVNSLVQRLLNRVQPWHYYLLRVQRTSFKDQVSIGALSELEGFATVKRIRVTRKQFTALQLMQLQYRQKGIAVSISDILVSILYQSSADIRDCIHCEIMSCDLPCKEAEIIAVQPLGAFKLDRCRRSFWNSDDKSWYYPRAEEHLQESTVYVS